MITLNSVFLAAAIPNKAEPNNTISVSFGRITGNPQASAWHLMYMSFLDNPPVISIYLNSGLPFRFNESKISRVPY